MVSLDLGNALERWYFTTQQQECHISIRDIFIRWRISREGAVAKMCTCTMSEYSKTDSMSARLLLCRHVRTALLLNKAVEAEVSCQR
jgi:hypothetical protein